MADTMTGHRCRVAVVAVDCDGPLARCPQCGNDGSIVAALRHGVVVVSDASTLDGCEHQVTVPLVGDVSWHRCRSCGRIDRPSVFHVSEVVARARGSLVPVAGGGFAVQERLL